MTAGLEPDMGPFANPRLETCVHRNTFIIMCVPSNRKYERHQFANSGASMYTEHLHDVVLILFYYFALRSSKHLGQ